MNNVNAGWVEVSVNCLNGVWHKCLPEFKHNFTGFKLVEKIAEDVSRLVQETGLDKVITT
jgi:hypothetical protein